MTLGSWPKVTAAHVREIVGPLAARVALGHDPAAEKQDERRSHNETVAHVIWRYLAAQSKRLRPRSLAEVERHLGKHARPLHGLPVSKLQRRDVADLLTDIANEGGPVAANRVRSSISAMLNWAMKAGLAESNPASFTNKESEKSRERVLTSKELAAVWAALPDSDYGDIVKLLILTGQRKSEIGDLRWSEIDMRRGTITLPSERLKNGRPHVIPMSEPVRSIFKEIPREPGRDFVFGFGSGGFSGWSRCKERLDASLPKMEPWTIHDLRRSCATTMAEIGVAPHIVEAVLNHASGHKGGIAGVYNHASYDKEKREALTRWAEHVIQIVGKMNRAA